MMLAVVKAVLCPGVNQPDGQGDMHFDLEYFADELLATSPAEDARHILNDTPSQAAPDLYLPDGHAYDTPPFPHSAQLGWIEPTGQVHKPSPSIPSLQLPRSPQSGHAWQSEPKYPDPHALHSNISA